MGSEWPRVPISDVCELIVDCVNKTAPTVEEPTPYKMIRTPNVKGGRVSTADCRFVTKETFEKWTRRAEVRVNDVLLTREAPLGEVGIVKSNERLFLGQRLMQYRADKRVLDPEFLVYAFLSRDLQHQFQMHEGSGSVVSHIRVGDCSKFELNLPPLPEQKRIANILGALDQKMDLNYQINTTIESMAQALFKSWFVDFDPVIDNALAAGNPVPEALQARADARAALGDQRKPLPDHIRQQFPDRFVLTEEMGWVPEGWVVGPVSTLAMLNPQAWTAKNHPDEIRYVDLSNTKKGRMTATEKLNFNNAPSRARRVLRKDDTIIGTVRPGNQAFAFIQDDGLTGSTGFAVLRPSESIHKCFVYYALTRRDTIDYFAHIADGGAYPAIKPSVIGDHLVLIPPPSVLTHFDAMASPILTKFGENELENRTLADLRDTLLPKLLSGELRISEAEKQVEEVI